MSNLGNKEIMSKNIQKYLDKCGINSKKLSEDIDTPYTTVRSWIQKENYPRIDKIELMANYFNITKSDLVEDKPKLPDGIIPINKARRIPILGSVACGTPIFSEQNIEDYFVTNDIIKADFCLYAKGDSMIEADINDGDLVFIRKTPAVDNGKIAVVLIGEETTLKRVYKTDHNLILHAENRTYQPLIYTEKDCETENIMVLGEMIGIYKNIKQ